jgi:aminoglycoside 3-N-acetyltransferase
MTSSLISAQLLSLGIRPGGVLLVHSSLRSLGPVEGGAEAVIAALLDALGPEGTLLMPALSYATVGPRNPHFDVLATPSCVGALAEAFRTRAGTLRSVHPTHSVSGFGCQARDLLAGQELDDTPCGPRSAFARLPQVGGQILFLGCGLRPNTSMHAVEECVRPPYLFGDTVDYTLRFADGSPGRMKVTGHNFNGFSQRYDRISALLNAPALRQGKALQAGCFLVDAAAMWEAALPALRRDNLYFVEPHS